MMMLDVLAAMAHVDYTKRHELTAQGRAKRIEKTSSLAPTSSTLEDLRDVRKTRHAMNASVSTCPRGYSWMEIMGMEKVSRGTVAKQAALLKADA
jgi:hypothetical protein